MKIKNTGIGIPGGGKIFWNSLGNFYYVIFKGKNIGKITRKQINPHKTVYFYQGDQFDRLYLAGKAVLGGKIAKEPFSRVLGTQGSLRPYSVFNQFF